MAREWESEVWSGYNDGKGRVFSMFPKCMAHLGQRTRSMEERKSKSERAGWWEDEYS